MTEDSGELEFGEIEFLRGGTPDDIKDKCFHLCKNYLGGVWLIVSIDEIEVKRLSGGYTNQLYYCAINKQIDSINCEPQEVAIRLYGDKHFNNWDCDGNERLSDVIIALMVSQYKLGPKIYGLFQGGQIQGYYKHKQFRVDEQNNPKLVEELARKLARIHAMDVPLKKSGNWIFKTFDTFYELADQRFDLKELFDKYNCETLIKYDLKQELQWLKTCVIETNSPVNFCHNDFRGSNIMVRDINNINDLEGDQIIFCDLEYSSYGLRGADFGTIFAEWGRPWSEYFNPHNYPEDSVIKTFIDFYISESTKILGKEYSANKINSMEQLLKEAKIFSLVSHMFVVTLLLKSDELIEETPIDKPNSMRFCEMCYKNYHQLKQKLINEEVIKHFL